MVVVGSTTTDDVTTNHLYLGYHCNNICVHTTSYCCGSRSPCSSLPSIKRSSYKYIYLYIYICIAVERIYPGIMDIYLKQIISLSLQSYFVLYIFGSRIFVFIIFMDCFIPSFSFGGRWRSYVDTYSL